jgi:hypothetical protein
MRHFVCSRETLDISDPGFTGLPNQQNAASEKAAFLFLI